MGKKQKEKLKNGVRKVKAGNINEYEPYMGSDGEKSSEVEFYILLFLSKIFESCSMMLDFPDPSIPSKAT